MRRILIRRLRTALGEIVAGADDEGICTLEFARRNALAEQPARAKRHVGSPLPEAHPHLDALETQLGEYFSGRRRSFDLPLVLAGTDFQERVWRTLLEIRHGTTVSYAELARRVGADAWPRAVGRANGANRIAILVPCHRVIRANGDLGGYSGGLARKRLLLELEADSAQRCLFRRSGAGALRG